MTDSVRPLRSVLYMPGANERALNKARTLPCDGIILDLEDAVSPAAKDEARTLIRSALEKGGYGNRMKIIRINSLDGPWGMDDLKAFASCAVDAILLPKVETPEQLMILDRTMTGLGYSDDTAIWAMTETPRGVLKAADIADSTPRLRCLVMGTNDLAKDLRIAPTKDRAAFHTSFGLAILAARAFNLAILDGVFTDLNDDPGFEAECAQGVSLGFDGKTLIHPKQIATANAAFRPSENALQHARRMIDAWKEAKAEGKAVATLDGKMIEQLHIDDANRLIALDKAIKKRGND